MRVYIAGPMRGFPRWNFDAFHAAERAWSDAGHVPVSPAAVDELLGFDPDGPDSQVDDRFMRDALARDAILIIYSCDAVAVLPGWDQSSGAKFEVSLAMALKKPIFDAATRKPIEVAIQVFVMCDGRSVKREEQTCPILD